MRTISPTDLIMVTSHQFGRMLVKFNSTGFSSTDEVMHRVSKELGSNGIGPINVRVRNYTQGWGEERKLSRSVSITDLMSRPIGTF